MIINELHLQVTREQSLDRQREAEKQRLVRQAVNSQKGDRSMLKMAKQYTRHALAILATVGFGSMLQ